MGLYYKNKFTIKTFASEINAKEITHFQRTKEGYIEFYSVIHCDGCDEMYQWGNPIEYVTKHTDKDIVNIINMLGAEYKGDRPFAHIKFNNWQNDIRTKYTGYQTTCDDIGAHESDGGTYCTSCHEALTEKVGYYGEKLNQESYDINDPIDKPMAEEQLLEQVTELVNKVDDKDLLYKISKIADNKIAKQIGEYGEKLHKVKPSNSLKLHKLDANFNMTSQSKDYDFIVLNKIVYTREK